MLRTNKIALRPLEERDLALLAEWRNDPAAFRWFASPRVLAVSEQADWYAQYRRDATQRQWMIEALSTGTTVGTLALFNIDLHQQSAEVGRVLIVPPAQRKGYAAAAVNLLIDYAFAELNLHRLTLVVFADNVAAMALYAKCGFVTEGLFDRAVWKAGAWRDLIPMALLREEL